MIYNGTSNNDTLNGTDSDDTLNGLEGNDTLFGKGGNDYLIGGDGYDILDGGTGGDRLEGGTGHDLYIVDNVNDVIIESGTNDLDGVQSSISWALGANLENLTLTGNNAINGTGNALNNVINGNAANNVLSGGDGDDLLYGGGGNDTLIGGAGNDRYQVDSANTIIKEGLNGGIDSVSATLDWTLGANLEKLYLLVGTTGRGNSLDNGIFGNFGDNVLDGKGGNDTIRGYGGNDSLIGGSGFDTLMGDTGNDTLVGGAGKDTLIGGLGYDRFDFYSPNERTDKIVDFSVSEDTIGISAQGFANAGLTPNSVIAADQFHIGTGAADASDRFIYNQNTGALFFDVDGIGSTAKVQIATLSTGLAMTNTNIFVF